MKTAEEEAVLAQTRERIKDYDKIIADLPLVERTALEAIIGKLIRAAHDRDSTLIAIVIAGARLVLEIQEDDDE